MLKPLYLAVVLSLFVGVFVGLVVKANDITQPIIEENKKQKELDAFQMVLPENDGLEDITSDNKLSVEIQKMIGAYKGGQLVGVAYKAVTPGFIGPIEYIVGFDVSNKNIVSLQYISTQETPGLGKLIEDDEFRLQFDALSIEADIMSEVDQVSGATNSSNAIRASVQKLVNNLIENGLAEGEIKDTNPAEIVETNEVDGATVYTITVQGIGKITLDVAIKDGVVDAITIIEHNETPDYGGGLIDQGYHEFFIGETLESVEDVDTVSGVTLTSTGIKYAVQRALTTYNE